MMSGIARCALALLLVLGGCGVELVGGGQRGETEVVMTDSPESGTSSASRAPSRALAPAPAEDGAPDAVSDDGGDQQVAVATGSLDVRATAALLSNDGDPLQLTTGSTRVELELGEADSVRVALRSLQAATYSGVRITFTQIQANLQTAVMTTAGALLEGEISVDLSAGPLTIDVPLNVVIEDDERTTLVVDLNSHLWLAYANPVTRRVSPDRVRAAVTVEVK